MKFLVILLLVPYSTACVNDLTGEPLPTDSPQCQVSNTSNLTITVNDLEANATRLATTLYLQNKSSGFRLNVSAGVTLTYWTYPPNTRNQSTQASFQGIGDSNDTVIVESATINNLTTNASAVLLVSRVASVVKSVATASGSDAKSVSLVSDVYSVDAFQVNSTGGTKLDKVSIPIVYTVNTTSVLVGSLMNKGRTVIFDTLKYTCVYYNHNTSSWSSYGCEATNRNGEFQHCRSNHTSSFGVLLSVRSIKVPPELTILTNVVEIISVVALFGTVVLLLWTRHHLPTERFLTQLGIALSLMLMHCSFLFGSLAYTVKNSGLCVFSTVIGHWMALTSAMWMFNEGAMLFFKTRRNALKFDPDRQSRKMVVSGWLFPLLYVSFCILGGFLSNSYMDKSDLSEFPYQRCWLGKQMTLALVIPLAVIFTTNAVILCVIIWKVRGMHMASRKLRPNNAENRRQSGSEDVRSEFLITAHALMILLPMLGVPWVLGLLVNVPYAELYFMSIHISLNGIQGLVVAIVVCFKNRELRLTAKRKIYNLGRERTKSLDFT